MSARLGILLSGSGSTYANLVDAIAAGRLPAQIAVVVSSKADIGGVARAQAYGHPLVIASDAATVSAALREHHCDVVAMCGWLKFYDPPAALRGRVVNIHPSLLPAFGGKGMYGIHVHRAVIAAGARESGCTAHLVSGDYDSGPHLGQQRVPVLPDDTPERLQARVQDAERALYPQVLRTLIASLK
ncbi:MAG TPA: phosphoribosylglycinamide formyltransferase [Planctomycetota bacterium]|jgi:phosphoribosylglycinamide formyltransferase-1|nr:phosphoribosylglycinamide formyltransferase [Planctomycetota bacterium]